MDPKTRVLLTRSRKRLARLDLDDFLIVSDALALIRFRLADGSHLGGEFTHRLLIRPGNVNLQAALNHHLHRAWESL